MVVGLGGRLEEVGFGGKTTRSTKAGRKEATIFWMGCSEPTLSGGGSKEPPTVLESVSDVEIF